MNGRKCGKRKAEGGKLPSPACGRGAGGEGTSPENSPRPRTPGGHRSSRLDLCRPLGHVRRPLTRRLRRHLLPQAGAARSRRGFTLVEMLIVVAIIGMLASISLAALAQVRSVARVERTKATIAKLNDIIMTRYASYQTRRVPIANTGAPPIVAQRRLAALRQLMRLEMPERATDIYNPYSDPAAHESTYEPGELDNASLTVPIPSTTQTNLGWMQRPALSRAYLRRWLASPQNGQHTPAECLYMIVTLGDPDARDQFSDNEIADVDGDTLPEFVDGWGNPIYFLRCAPGFNDSDIQLGFPVSPEDALSDHDPFDGRKVDVETPSGDPSGWRLMPLIYSAGPNGEYGIAIDTSLPSPPYAWANDSYDYDSTVPGQQVWGLTSLAGDHLDNIHNHRIEAD